MQKPQFDDAYYTIPIYEQMLKNRVKIFNKYKVKLLMTVI